MNEINKNKEVIVLPEGEGRVYACGSMTAIFKTDEEETSSKYSVSEWWLDPNSGGPGAHQHEENDEVFYVLEGTTSFLVGDRWINANKGTFLRIPCKTIHDFEIEQIQKQESLIFLFQEDSREICLP